MNSLKHQSLLVFCSKLRRGCLNSDEFGLAADYKTDEADKRINEQPIRYIRFIRYQNLLPIQISNLTQRSPCHAQLTLKFQSLPKLSSRHLATQEVTIAINNF